VFAVIAGKPTTDPIFETQHVVTHFGRGLRAHWRRPQSREEEQSL
jgi:hypothetical protein